MRFFVGDTETSGLKGKVMEIAFIEICPETLEIENSWQSLIDPEIPCEPGAFAIHGISDEMVATEPTIEEFVSVVMGGRIEEPCTLVSHNVRFDRPFFEPVMNVTTTFCTLQMVRQMFPREVANHKLGTMKEHLELEGGPAHRAMGDVLTVHQMLRKLLPSTGKTLLDHLQVPARTVYTMPFGEHKGKMLMDLPAQYRTWLLSIDIDADLRRSLMKLRETGI